MTPSAIELHKKSRQLELRYANGDCCKLDAEYLRVFSPSAEVRGHHPAQAVLQHGKQQVGILAVSMVGNYALQISFDDGHDSGIYAWTYLRELADQHAENWADYLHRLQASGASRDPDAQVISIFDPHNNT